jgi:predicted metal-dependent TIM-barrel fold hydrolase
MDGTGNEGDWLNSEDAMIVLKALKEEGLDEIFDEEVYWDGTVQGFRWATSNDYDIIRIQGLKAIICNGKYGKVVYDLADPNSIKNIVEALRCCYNGDTLNCKTCVFLKPLGAKL